MDHRAYKASFAMQSSGHSRWTRTDSLDDADDRIETLQKSIKEQQVLLSTLHTDQHPQGQSDMDIEQLKTKIRHLCREMDRSRSTLSRYGSARGTDAGWETYQRNTRRLQDLEDQRRSLTKEINYLVDMCHDTKSILIHECDRSGIIDTSSVRDGESIAEKAQAMITARLQQHQSTSDNHLPIMTRIDQLVKEIEEEQSQVDRLVKECTAREDEQGRDSQQILRDRQMFEQGLFVSNELATFIDQISGPAPISLTIPTIITPSEPSPPPPPVPTSQRPGTPRSAEDIKAEARRRIEERKKLLLQNTGGSSVLDTRRSVPNLARVYNQEELDAQDRMRQAESESLALVESMRAKRNKAREAAAKAEAMRKKVAAEAEAKAATEMEAERQKKQKEEEERQAALQKAKAEEEEKKRIAREAELATLRKEQEEQERKERELLQKRQEEERLLEESRQRKARLAAEKAAMEKRLHREEIERQRSAIEEAKQEELRRRRAWEEAEAKKRQEERARLEEQVNRLRADHEARLAANALASKADHEHDSQSDSTASTSSDSSDASDEEGDIGPSDVYNITTAATSGYGVDIEDEVDFGTIYRVKALYEYRAARDDDLSFQEDEEIKAHPSKDKASDWWYGTSLVTQQSGFFPHTYVEIIERAFRVRALYEFRKARDDDLAFSENDIIRVQPFQDENSEWYYGTHQESGQSGYFPKLYCTDIPSHDTESNVNTPVVMNKPDTGDLSKHIPIPESPSRGVSAPNTPVMRKASLGKTKQTVTRRRRAASNAGSATNSVHGVSTELQQTQGRPLSPHVSHWADTMDPNALAKVPAEERVRQEAIFELISTEQSYLHDLQMLIEVFYDDCGKYLTIEEQDVIFSNIEDLLVCNTEFLSDLENRQRETGPLVSGMGDVFLKHAANMKTYAAFCRNQSFASKLLQKKRQEDQWFDVFLKTAQTRPECRSLDLGHFLLQPVQRITRYPLLLRQILKSTPKKHADFGLVKSALAQSEDILADVNEETRRYENKQQIQGLSRILDMEQNERLDVPGREFVMEGVVHKVRSGRKLHMYLFNDMLLLAEPLKSLSARGYLYRLYRDPMFLDSVTIRASHHVSLRSTFGGHSSSDDSIFQIVCHGQVITIKVATPSVKKAWTNQIQHYSALRMTMTHPSSPSSSS